MDERGEKNIKLAEENMLSLMEIRKRLEKEKPFKDIAVGMALHVTKETGVLVETLIAGGAKVAIASCNPLSTQDDIVEYLKSKKIDVFAKKGQSDKEYYDNLNKVIKSISKYEKITLIDDGGDLIGLIHNKYPKLIKKVIVACEETTTGVIRLRNMEKAGKLKFPVIAVNDNKTKHLFDNYYGTGQSTLDGIIRASNIMIAGKIVVVAGYGSCGKGVAQKARGLGANVIVTEVNPIESLRARFDGFRVMMMEDACKEGDIFITVTGDINVITMNHIQYMKDGVILANSGHFDCEIDTKNMKKEAKKIENIRPYFDKYYFSLDYQRPNYVYLCGDGRLVNLACAEGHPSIVMSTSFCGQVLALEYGLEVQESIKSDDLCEHCFGNNVHTLPEYLDQEIAKLQLESLGIEIDELTEEQIKYLNSWEAGT